MNENQQLNSFRIIPAQLEVDGICDQLILQIDSDVDNNQMFSFKCNQFVKASKNIMKYLIEKEKSNQIQQNIMNSSRGRASILALENNKTKINNKDKRKNGIQLLREKRVLRLSENYFNQNEEEFKQRNRNRIRIVELQFKKIDIQQISFIEVWDYLKLSQHVKEQLQFLELSCSLLKNQQAVLLFILKYTFDE
ncbi:unnamed protein product [Paramecium octaurelia]|uniref:Uncharacterized protein n=1 Tax=Paramecium octaurelia TaxID=43137 RepID=A0A8S1VCL4_PAROT|nr:unnamed protein product [Paramecium octaurelia]